VHKVPDPVYVVIAFASLREGINPIGAGEGSLFKKCIFKGFDSKLFHILCRGSEVGGWGGTVERGT